MKLIQKNSFEYSREITSKEKIEHECVSQHKDINENVINCIQVLKPSIRLYEEPIPRDIIEALPPLSLSKRNIVQLAYNPMKNIVNELLLQIPIESETSNDNCIRNRESGQSISLMSSYDIEILQQPNASNHNLNVITIENEIVQAKVFSDTLPETDFNKKKYINIPVSIEIPHVGNHQGDSIYQPNSAGYHIQQNPEVQVNHCHIKKKKYSWLSSEPPPTTDEEVLLNQKMNVTSGCVKNTSRDQIRAYSKRTTEIRKPAIHPLFNSNNLRMFEHKINIGGKEIRKQHSNLPPFYFNLGAIINEVAMEEDLKDVT